jgi:hypothetical protein
MTEADWLTCRNPWDLFIRRRGIPLRSRKVRLALCGAYRRVWGRMSGAARTALEVAEAFADGQANVRQLFAAQSIDLNEDNSADLGIRCLATSNKHLRSSAGTTLHCAAQAISEVESERAAERAAQCVIVLDVMGNPFRPASLNPACRTSAVTSLAQAAYEERSLPDGHLDLIRLAILADALEETICVNDRIVSHLRSVGPHVRGCWVLDLVLGKQ